MSANKMKITPFNIAGSPANAGPLVNQSLQPSTRMNKDGHLAVPGQSLMLQSQHRSVDQGDRPSTGPSALFKPQQQLASQSKNFSKVPPKKYKSSTSKNKEAAAAADKKEGDKELLYKIKYINYTQQMNGVPP